MSALPAIEQRLATPAPERMRAARIVGPGVVRLEEVSLPEPGPTQVRFRVKGCGVTRAVAAKWRGTRSHTYPRPAGESAAEAWGVVDAVGKQVQGLRPGDAIAALSTSAHADYDLAEAGAVLRLPAGLGDTPFPSQALAGAFHVFEQCRIETGQVVGVVGAGFLGALLIRLAADAGAQVVALSRRPFSLTVAREMGAHSVIELEEQAHVLQQLQGTLNGRLCDVVIEATGEQAALDWAGRLAAVRGRLVIAGKHEEPRQVDMPLWNQRGLEVLNTHDEDPATLVAGMREASEALSAGRLSVATLLTHRYSLSELETALELSERRPLGFVKALIAP